MATQDRTMPSQMVRSLAVAGLLVWFSGCASLTSVPHVDGNPAGFAGNDASAARNDVTPNSPMPKLFPPPTPDSIAGPIEQSAVAPASATETGDRYIARQVPNNYGQPSQYGASPYGTTPYGSSTYGNPQGNGYTFSPPAGPPLPPNSGYAAPNLPAPGQPNPYAPQPQSYPPSYPQQPYGSPVYGQPGVPQSPPIVSYQGSTNFQSMPSLGENIFSPGTAAGSEPLPPLFTPTIREADLIINGYPARTGRLMLGGAVNSDAGVTGQITIDERNFDITRWPRSFQDLFSGTAFRGAGETFRLEAAPGSDFQRYTINYATPNLFRYLPLSMSVSGFLYDRRFNDWDENRLGARTSLGYRITPDLSLAFGVSGQNVEISRPSSGGVAALNDVLGDNAIFSGNVSLTHDTRNSAIQASEGHYFETGFEQAFGDFDYSRFKTEYRQYWLLAERADNSGRQTISYSTQLGFSGDDTPIFENFFAGGYATIRGFDFRGASPVAIDGTNLVEVGGRFQWLNSVEYMFPITADDAFRGVAFVDFGTVEQEIEINEENFRVAPGFGVRVAIPMLGPAPLAFDFAFPVAKADTDDERMFSFYMSLIR